MICLFLSLYSNKKTNYSLFHRVYISIYNKTLYIDLYIMPLITSSSYHAPNWLRNGHSMTIFAHLKRNVTNVNYKRRRYKTKDNDFFDVDFLVHKNVNKAVCILHGLEGNSSAYYVKGLAKELYASGKDVYCINFRGCSGVPNNKEASYHSCFSEDLNDFISRFLVEKKKYKEIFLSGFSLGGNVTLHYLGTHAHALAKEIKAAIVFSVPVNLSSCAKRMAQIDNKIYMSRFLDSFGKKIKEKRKLFPGVKILNRNDITNFIEYDREYTAPQNGFLSETHYYNFCSSRLVLHNIKIPTLLVNAKDDPFLTEECFPYSECQQSDYVFLETPEYGGHCAFLKDYSGKGGTYIDSRTLRFFEEYK
jgi:uncharacterized protein